MKKPDILTTVRFYKPEEGGRKIATPEKFFKCPFKFENEMFDCKLLLDGIGSISPGETRTIPIKFLYPDLIKGRLSKGANFYLWDGRIIAKGVIEEIL